MSGVVRSRERTSGQCHTPVKWKYGGGDWIARLGLHQRKQTKKMYTKKKGEKKSRVATGPLFWFTKICRVEWGARAFRLDPFSLYTIVRHLITCGASRTLPTKPQLEILSACVMHSVFPFFFFDWPKAIDILLQPERVIARACRD